MNIVSRFMRLGFNFLLIIGFGGVSLTAHAQQASEDVGAEVPVAEKQVDEGRRRYLRRFGLLAPQKKQDAGANSDAAAALQSSRYRARVRAPKYYNYKPDRLVSVSFRELAQIETASAEPLGPDTLEYLQKSPFTSASVHLMKFRIGVLPEVGAALKAHYVQDPNFIWVTNNRVNGRAYAAIAALARADRFGLTAKHYLVQSPPYDFDREDMAARQEDLITFEIRLSAAVLSYILDATRGRVDPNRISQYHDLKRNSVDLESALAVLAVTADAGDYLDRRSSTNRYFNSLVDELAALRGGDGTNPVIAPGTFVRPGANSKELPNIMAALDLKGSADLKSAHSSTIGAYAGEATYGSAIVALVRDFQRENSLHVDGIIGRRTITALKADTDQSKIDKVLLAMERARWLPRDLGSRHVFVNQPAFQATYVHKGNDPLSMRVVVGTKRNQTSFFRDEIEKVEYNPYWGVPYSIIVNEMMPKLARDRGYLDRIGYEVTTMSGKRVSSRSVNWYAVRAKKKLINVKQPPGPKNALGQLKILFPNKHEIYMHDTPHKSLFDKDVRAFSHGCIRLHDPQGMAAAVLETTRDDITAKISYGVNSTQFLSAPIPIYVSYFTAWPDGQGRVQYYRDMYDRDVYLSRAVKSADRARRGEG